MRKIVTPLLKFLFPIIFTGYIGVLSFYVHVHWVDGETVVHSHPFKNLPGHPFHSHTVSDLWLVHNLSSYSATADVVPHFEWEVLWIELYDALRKPASEGIRIVISGALFLRAPPFAF